MQRTLCPNGGAPRPSPRRREQGGWRRRASRCSRTKATPPGGPSGPKHNWGFGESPQGQLVALPYGGDLPEVVSEPLHLKGGHSPEEAQA